MITLLNLLLYHQNLGTALDVLAVLAASMQFAWARQPWRKFMAAKYTMALCVLDLALIFSIQAERTTEHTAFVAAALVLAVHSQISHTGNNINMCLHLARATRIACKPNLLWPVAAAVSIVLHILLAWFLANRRLKKHVKVHLNGILGLQGFSLLFRYYKQQKKLYIEDMHVSDSEKAFQEELSNTEFNPNARFFVIRAIILKQWKTMASLVAANVLVGVAIHYRRLVFVNILARIGDQTHMDMGNFATLLIRKIERLEKESRTHDTPRIRSNFHNLGRDIRGIKFHAWENAFRNVRVSMDIDDFIPPLFWRISSLLVDLVGSAISQIASAIAIMSAIQSSDVATYTEVILLMGSIDSLTTFSTTASALGTIYIDIKKSTAFLSKIIAGSDSQYIQLDPEPSAMSAELTECTFRWGPDAFSVRCPLLTIAAGEFVTVVGRVGSGKSSLMSALCGEMPIISGQGQLCGRIGFVDQKPTVLDTTFRENVLMGNEYNEKWFNQVIYACALSQDLKQMENGDQTKVGFGGVNLSGGQKTRLALARALYLKADVYIFDDLLSAVDAHVERHIIENVLVAGGIISTKTRILVTHAEHVIPLSDKVVTLTDGQVQVVKQMPVQLSGDLTNDKIAQSESAAVEDQELAENPEPFVIHPDYDDPPLRWTSFKKYIALSGYWTVAAVAAIQLVSACALFYIDSLRINMMTDSNPETMIQSLKWYLLINAIVEILRQQLQNFEPAAGKIIIDGIDIATIGLHDLRSRVSIIPQDPTLFSGTIRDNLDPMDEYTDDEDPDDDDNMGIWVEGVGLNKWVMYNGSNFSVGERQLISLCRALLWRRKILILDEATANIDNKTDQLIQTVLRKEFKDCTILTIAHRLNTVMDCNRILVMDQGTVAEFDTPKNLLARDGPFTQLVASMKLNRGELVSNN
ncbi:ABC transporter C member 13 [Coemansia sp. RSA 1199]|nr:ABC transporter C member 13 [Coemansia sp. RSA 1199]